MLLDEQKHFLEKWTHAFPENLEKYKFVKGTLIIHIQTYNTILAVT